MSGTILVIDDEEPIRVWLATLFDTEEYRVVTANDGAEGLARIESERPGLVFLDLRMPTMSGWEVIRELRQGWGDRRTPVVAFSAEPSEVGEIQKAGFTAYLTKWSSVDQILCTARTCLGEKAMQVVGDDWLHSCNGERCLRSRDAA